MKQSDTALIPDDGLADTYLTTKQVAALLHVKERKIYDLAAAGDIPGTRALGKWLFQRDAIFDWLNGHSNGTSAVLPAAPNVVLGSHDPLLEWAVRESGSGLAMFLDGSIDGLNRFARNEGGLAGLHIFDAANDIWNANAVRATLPQGAPAVLVEWAWRHRGLIVAEGNPKQINSIADLRGKRLASRQESAGTHVLLNHFLKQAGIAPGDVDILPPARTESDAALAVIEGEADVTFGLHCIARQYRLDFAPVVRERFDLLVWWRDWFQPPMQRLLAFTKTESFAKKAAALTGYEVSGLGTVHMNSVETD